MNPHFTALEAAYQLHYYLWFKTHYLQALLTREVQSVANLVVDDVCTREQYHLLSSDMTDNQIRLLISLRPDHKVSQVVKRLKGNLQHQLRKTFNSENVLAKGYFARSSGKIDLACARQYVESQTSHHGYKGEWTKPMKYRNETFKSPTFRFDHCATILNYHFVFATQNRIAVFDETLAPGFFEYIVSVGKKHSFEIDRIGLLPDHMHLIIEGVPTISVEEYALAILNNTRHWMEKNYLGILKNTGAWNVWQPSFYAATVGEYTTAQVKNFLRS